MLHHQNRSILKIIISVEQTPAPVDKMTNLPLTKLKHAVPFIAKIKYQVREFNTPWPKQHRDILRDIVHEIRIAQLQHPKNAGLIKAPNFNVEAVAETVTKRTGFLTTKAQIQIQFVARDCYYQRKHLSTWYKKVRQIADDRTAKGQLPDFQHPHLVVPVHDNMKSHTFWTPEEDSIVMATLPTVCHLSKHEQAEAVKAALGKKSIRTIEMIKVDFCKYFFVFQIP